VLDTSLNTYLPQVVMGRIRQFKHKTRLAISCYKFRRQIKGGTRRIVVGSGGLTQPGWAASDIACLNILKERDWVKCLDSFSLEAILAEHVLEHLPDRKGFQAASNCFRHLKSGGYLRLAVPDGFHPDPKYINQVKPGGSGPGAEDHKVLYNHHTISDLFEKAGFEVKLLEWFDEEGVFHYEEWSPEDGLIIRSTRFDGRNKQNPTAYTSLIVDAVKPK